MATYREIIQSIKDIHTGGNLHQFTDISTISDDLILFLFNNARNFYVAEEIRATKKTNEFNYQTLCVDLACASTTECCELGAIDAIYLRSVFKIPKLFPGGLKFVGDAFGTQAYDFVPFSVIRTSNTKYPPRKIQAFMHNDYLFLKTPNLEQSSMSITVLAEDPLLVTKLMKNCSGVSSIACSDPLEDDYPVASAKLPAIYKLLFSNELRNYSIKEGTLSPNPVPSVDDKNN